MWTVPAVGILALSLTACAANPKPGESGYPYNLTGTYEALWMVAGEANTGGMELVTAPGGAVSGSFQVVQPSVVLGTVEGQIVADTIDFQMPYQRDECGGVVYGRNAIAAGGLQFGGAVRLVDECAGEMTGTMEVRR